MTAIEIFAGIIGLLLGLTCLFAIIFMAYYLTIENRHGKGHTKHDKWRYK